MPFGPAGLESLPGCSEMATRGVALSTGTSVAEMVVAAAVMIFVDLAGLTRTNLFTSRKAEEQV